jgi:DNA-binding NarL/FixJ family response regulator
MIVDDHEVVRMGLRTLVEHQGGLQVVGEAGTAAKALSEAIATKPDVVLMDVRLPDETGIEACRRIRSELPRTRVLMLTSFSDEEAIFASIVAGASGYLLKRIEAEQLYQAIIAVARGESLLDPRVSKQILERVNKISQGDTVRGMDSLTRREAEILKLIAEGLTNKEIAKQVFLSEGSVRNYVSSILQKLDLSHRTQAAVYYIERKTKD